VLYKMKITRSNYESWFLDYLEGNLDASLMDEFRVFLDENPDLAAELEMGELVKLESNIAIQFDAKEELKKSVSDQQVEFEEWAVAYHEGDLSLSDRISFEASLSENSTNATEVEQFGKLKLVADTTIVYENKEQLKRRGTIVPLWIKVASVAAILLLAYLLFQPGIGVRPVSVQLADDIRNKETKNIVAPARKAKVEAKIIEEITRVVTPKRIPAIVPVKQKAKSAAEKPEKKLIPTPHLRAPETEPLPLKPRGISIGHPVDTELAVMTLKAPAPVSEDFELSELLKVQLAAMRKSDDREFLSTEHLGLSGLQLVAKLSGKRLTARKGDDGIVRSVSFNSHLLAFSIPVNR